MSKLAAIFIVFLVSVIFIMVIGAYYICRRLFKCLELDKEALGYDGYYDQLEKNRKEFEESQKK